jgi:hypothetical protein
MCPSMSCPCHVHSVKNLVTILLVSLLASVGDAAKLPLAGELLVEHLELVDELLAHRGEDIARRDGAVGLHADEKLRDVRVGN